MSDGDAARGTEISEPVLPDVEGDSFGLGAEDVSVQSKAHDVVDALPSHAGGDAQRKRMLPPLLSRASFHSSPSRVSSMVGPMVGRRSFIAPLRGSTLDSFDFARRSTFLLKEEEVEMLQRLSEAGLRHSMVSEMTDDGPGGVTACVWWRHRFRVLRLRLWLFFEEPFIGWRSSIFCGGMVMIIVASIACSVGLANGQASTSSPSERLIESVDFGFNVIFCVDLLVRAWAFPLLSKFLTHPRNTVDAVSVLPFIIVEVVALDARLPSLAFMRWVRSLEAFLRFLKLSRYFSGWQLLFRALSDSAAALRIPLFFLCLIVMLGSSLLYIFEVVEDADGEAFEALDEGELYHRLSEGLVTVRTLFDAIHFSIVCVLSMSTGPFYSMQASSVGGKLTVCALMVFGMVFGAMPIAIVGSCFSNTWFDKDRIVLLAQVRSRLNAQGYTPEDVRDVFDEVDVDGSGEIEYGEFKKMLRTFNLRSLNAAKCRRLFHYFDNDGDGAVSFTDFALTLYPDLQLDEPADECQSESSSEDDDSGPVVRVSANRSRPGSAKSTRGVSSQTGLPASSQTGVVRLSGSSTLKENGGSGGSKRAKRFSLDLGVSMGLVPTTPRGSRGGGSRSGSIRDGVAAAVQADPLRSLSDGPHERKSAAAREACAEPGARPGRDRMEFPSRCSKEPACGHAAAECLEAPTWVVEPPPLDADGHGGPGVHCPPSSANSLGSARLDAHLAGLEGLLPRASNPRLLGSASASSSAAPGGAAPQAPAPGSRDDVLLRRLEQFEQKMDRRLDRLASFVLHTVRQASNPAGRGMEFLQGRQQPAHKRSLNVEVAPEAALRPDALGDWAGVHHSSFGGQSFSRPASARRQADLSRRGSLTSQSTQARVWGGRASRLAAPKPKMRAQQERHSDRRSPSPNLSDQAAVAG